MPLSVLNGVVHTVNRRMRSMLESRALTRSTAAPSARTKSASSTRPAKSAGPGGDEVGVGNQQRHQVRPLVAMDHGLNDLRLEAQKALDPRRRDVVAAGEDDDVLLAVGDAQEVVGVEGADIAGMQPAVANDCRRRLRIAPITGSHRLAAHQDLAVTGDLDLEVG